LISSNIRSGKGKKGWVEPLKGLLTDLMELPDFHRMAVRFGKTSFVAAAASTLKARDCFESLASAAVIGEAKRRTKTEAGSNSKGSTFDVVDLIKAATDFRKGLLSRVKSKYFDLASDSGSNLSF